MVGPVVKAGCVAVQLNDLGGSQNAPLEQHGDNRHATQTAFQQSAFQHPFPTAQGRSDERRGFGLHPEKRMEVE